MQRKKGQSETVQTNIFRSTRTSNLPITKGAGFLNSLDKLIYVILEELIVVLVKELDALNETIQKWKDSQ